VEKFLDTPVKRYSSGMYVRLAFAVAAHLEPEILIVDEVLAVGDAQFQKKCLGKMDEVSTKDGRTVLFVSHNMEAIKNLCSRTILLNKGEVISDATTEKALMLYNEMTRDIKVDSETGINDEKYRRGEGAIRFTSVELLNMHGEKQTTFEMGETIRFRLSYKVFKKMEGITIYICLRSGTTREFVTSVKHVITAGNVDPGTSGKIIVELPDIYIRPGQYPLYLHLSDNDLSSNSIDVLDDLTAPLNIYAGDNRQYDNFDPKHPNGYFSLPSRMVLNELE
jgi:lipopolysaccharide transport system ATP-binding protein